MIPNPPNKNRFRKLVTEQPPHNSHSPSLLPQQPSQAEGALKQSLYSRKITRNTIRLQSQQHEKDQPSINKQLHQHKLRTITSLQQPQTQINKLKDQFSDYRLKRHTQLKNTLQPQLKLQKLISLIHQFEQHTNAILKAPPNNENININNFLEEEEEQEEKYTEASKRTKLSAARLINIYLQRQLKLTKKYALEVLVADEKYQFEEEDYLSSFLPMGPPSGQSRPSKVRSNLINIDKFLCSK